MDEFKFISKTLARNWKYAAQALIIFGLGVYVGGQLVT